MNQLCSIKGDVCSVASFWRTCEVRNFFMARYSFPSVTNSRSNKQCDPVLEQFRCTRLSVWYLPFSISYKQKVLCPARVVYWFLPLLEIFSQNFRSAWWTSLFTVYKSVYCAWKYQQSKSTCQGCNLSLADFIGVRRSHASHIHHFISW